MMLQYIVSPTYTGFWCDPFFVDDKAGMALREVKACVGLYGLKKLFSERSFRLIPWKLKERQLFGY